MKQEADDLDRAEPFLEAAIDGMTAQKIPGAGNAMLLYGLDAMYREACCDACFADELEELSRVLAEQILELRGNSQAVH